MSIAGEAMQPELVERITRAYASVGTALAFGEPIPYSAKVNRCALALSQVINGEITALGGCPRKNPPAFCDHVALEEP